jgi:threonyl-tRNA synthetase
MKRIFSTRKFKTFQNFSSFREHRLKVLEEVISISKPNIEKEIQITLPNGDIKNGVSGVTKPLDILPPSILNSIIICKEKNNQLIELFSPFKETCSIDYVEFESDIGKKVFWHSSAHILGNAIELFYENSLLDDGPATKNGFFYDFQSKTNPSVNDFENLEKLINIKEPFEKYVIPKELAMEMFKYNPNKLKIIQNSVDEISIYRCGDFIDLCRGPHIYHSKLIQSMKFLNCNSINENTSRIYGISFPHKKLMRKWEENQKEIAKRDHRNIGKQQDLFVLFPESPGSPFFLPHGTRIFNRLLTLLRKEYKKRNYLEVITPQIYNKSLWETSGHWENYKEDMHLLCDGESGLKPMNCPAHCLIFGSKLRSYKELPLKYADFSPLHRNENTGSLTGLTRVRRFHQDDSHIFCTIDQIQKEIEDCIQFLKYVYDLVGFQLNFYISTRPDKYMGSIEHWDQAESSLKEALTRLNCPFNIKEKDGSFYGPKSKHVILF